MPPKLNIAVFASGKGSNFRAILDAIRDGKIHNAAVRVVISNNSSAGALDLARERGIPARHISRAQFQTDEEYNRTILETLRRNSVNFIVLAGYMKKIDPVIISQFKNRMINIHPALLPRFGGKGMFGIHVHEAVIKSGESESGATVHVVDGEYDHGTILMQKKVAVDPSETAESLARKVLAVEHELFPEVVRRIAVGELTLDTDHPHPSR